LSSAKGLAAAGVRYSGYDFREFEDLFHSLSRSELLVLAEKSAI
jgi:hypothetical protein